MWAINAAYAAGDLEKLEQLLLEPDAPHTIAIQTEEAQLELLTRELTRVQNRLHEIEDELARLDKHQSAVMMRRQEKAERAGRDWFGELEIQLRDDIAKRQIERDVLEEQLASMEEDEFGEDTAVYSEDFADLVFDVTLDGNFDDPDISAEFDRYIDRRRSKNYFEEDFEDDYDFD
jgi:hypothetical protein